MGRHGQEAKNKTTAAVIKARARKRRNRADREQRLRGEAAQRGISVDALIAEKALEVKAIIDRNRIVYKPPPPRRDRWGDSW